MKISIMMLCVFAGICIAEFCRVSADERLWALFIIPLMIAIGCIIGAECGLIAMEIEERKEKK